MENNMEEQVGEIFEVESSANDSASAEVKSIEIDLQVMRTFFVHTIALYEVLIKNNCDACNIFKTEEFVTLHKNLCDFEGIFNYFEVPFDKNLINKLVKMRRAKRDASSMEEDGDEMEDFIPAVDKKKKSNLEIAELLINSKILGKYSCFVPSCNLTYSTEDGAKIHFMKNHCLKGNIFDAISNDGSDIDFRTVPQDTLSRFQCQYDGCTYSSADRSNFRVHMKRHRGLKKFICPACSKTFYTRDPLMIHYLRLHMKDIDWVTDIKDLRFLRKTIRRLTNKENLKYDSNDQLDDCPSDLHGPVNENESILNQYVSNAITSGQVGVDKDDHNVNKVELGGASSQAEDEVEPVNSFNVSLSLKDVDFFSDSVTFTSEGGSTDINEIIKTQKLEGYLGASSSITTRMALQDTKDKVVKTTIPQRAKKFRCPHSYCGQNFFTMKNLLIHLKASHDPDNPIECTEAGCSSRFKSTALLAQHQKRHQVQYTCTLCPYKTHLAALMTRHNRQHAGKQLCHECEECHQRFEYLGALSSHRKKVHDLAESLYCTWEGCEKRFKTLVGLNKHKRELHMKMKPEIICDWPDCSAMFTSRTSMTNHRRIHTNERPYRCEWQDCGKYFRLKETLKRHVKIHQGVLTVRRRLSADAQD